MLSLTTCMVILDDCVRHELKDYAFGDMEVTWTKDGEKVASGYFGGGHASVSIYRGAKQLAHYVGEYAYTLKERGKTVETSRNDETGPDEFEIGKVMPGLTKEGVLRELTRE